MEAGGDTLQAKRRHLPIPVATRAPHQVELARDAIAKRLAQFAKQRGIGTRSGGECCVEGTCFISHIHDVNSEWLNRGLLGAYSW